MSYRDMQEVINHLISENKKEDKATAFAIKQIKEGKINFEEVSVVPNNITIGSLNNTGEYVCDLNDLISDNNNFKEKIKKMEMRINELELKNKPLASQSNGRESQIETLPGGENLEKMSDLEYFQHNLWRGLRVPASYMNEQEKTIANIPRCIKNKTGIYAWGDKTIKKTTHGVTYIGNGMHSLFDNIFAEEVQEESKSEETANDIIVQIKEKQVEKDFNNINNNKGGIFLGDKTDKENPVSLTLTYTKNGILFKNMPVEVVQEESNPATAPSDIVARIKEKQAEKDLKEKANHDASGEDHKNQLSLEISANSSGYMYAPYVPSLKITRVKDSFKELKFDYAMEVIK